MVGAATNNAEVQKFVVQLARSLRNPYSASKPYLVLDNHPSHRSSRTREVLERYFRPLFQPAQTSQVNCEETVFSSLKSRFRKQLFRRESNIATMPQFRSFVSSICLEMQE